jgi:hypothetical protein
MKLKYKLIVGIMVLVPIFTFALEVQTRIESEAAVKTETAVTSVIKATSETEVKTTAEVEVNTTADAEVKDSNTSSGSRSGSRSGSTSLETDTAAEVESTRTTTDTSVEINSVTSVESANSNTAEENETIQSTETPEVESTKRAISVEVASESLVLISDKLIDIDQEALKVRNDLRSQIKDGIDKAVSYIRVQAEVQEKPVEQAFMYQRFVADILDESLKLIEESIRFNIPTSESEVNELADQLDIYIIDIEESLEAYSDIILDMQDSRDEVSLTMSVFAEIIASKESQLIENGADLINLDTDLDGLSDYDEVYIFNTDPNNARTAGGDLNDSEKVSRGINPRSVTQDPIDFTDPRTETEAPTSKIYNVTRVELVDENGESISSTTQSTQKRVRLTGTGLPNSFITVYVFSTPVIVTVKTDSRGEWTYTLDKELEDGEHEIHVATVDNSGKILAKSNAIPFTQTASAASIGGFVGIGDETDTGTGNFIQDNFLIVVIIIVLVGILITISLFGKKELKVVVDGADGMNVKDTDINADTNKTEDK